MIIIGDCIKICPNCKNVIQENENFCINCNTYLYNSSFKFNDSPNLELNNNITNLNIKKKKTNSIFSIISIMCSVIGIIGLISVPQVINLVQLVLTPLMKSKGIFFNTYFHFNGIFIIFSFLSWIFGKMHKNRYNERCTGYIIGGVLILLYLIEFFVMLVMYYI